MVSTLDSYPKEMSSTYQKRVPNILRKKIAVSTEPPGKIISSSIKIIQEKEIKGSEKLVLCEKGRKPSIKHIEKEIPLETKKKDEVPLKQESKKKTNKNTEILQEPLKQASKKKKNTEPEILEEEPPIESGKKNSNPAKKSTNSHAKDLFLENHQEISTTLKAKELDENSIVELLDYFHDTMLYTNDAKKAMTIFSVLYKQAIVFRRDILCRVVKIMADIFFEHISYTYPNAFPEFLHVILNEKNMYSSYLYYVTLFTNAKKTPFVGLVDTIFLHKTGRNIAADVFDFDFYTKPKTKEELYTVLSEEANDGKFNGISLLYYMEKNDTDLIRHFYKNSASVYDSGMLLENLVKYSYFFTDAKTFRFFAMYLYLVVVYGIYVDFSTKSLYENARDNFDETSINTFGSVGEIPKRKKIQKPEATEDDIETFNKLL